MKNMAWRAGGCAQGTAARPKLGRMTLRTAPALLMGLAVAACASRPPPPPPAAGGGMGGRGLEMLLSADTNSDGVITRAEFVSARQARFSQMDRNGDGYLSRDDAAGGGQMRRGRLLRRGGGGGGERLRQAMDAIDRDGDGRVSRAEFVDNPAALFDRADTDRNDRLDPREIEDLRARMAAMRSR